VGGSVGGGGKGGRLPVAGVAAGGGDGGGGAAASSFSFSACLFGSGDALSFFTLADAGDGEEG